MKKLNLIICLFCNTILSIAQSDSSSTHGTIKISKPEGRLYIKTYTDFHVYYNDPVNALSYSDFVLSIEQQNPVKRSGRFIIMEAIPKISKDTMFNYTDYFSSNELIKKIRLQSDETDTVRLLIYVDIKGVVKYTDLAPKEKHGEDIWVYDMRKHEYKIDVVHDKTNKVFNELILEGWNPAKIKTLKKYPSKHKVKYDSTDAYMQGILTIIYSGAPFR